MREAAIMWLRFTWARIVSKDPYSEGCRKIIQPLLADTVCVAVISVVVNLKCAKSKMVADNQVNSPTEFSSPSVGAISETAKVSTTGQRVNKWLGQLIALSKAGTEGVGDQISADVVDLRSRIRNVALKRSPLSEIPSDCTRSAIQTDMRPRRWSL
jgi:hypothetical protein